MNEPTAAKDDDRQQAALAWLVRLNGEPSRDERRDFDAWVALPDNRDAFTRAETLWRRTEAPALALAQEESAGLDRLVTAATAPLPPRRLVRRLSLAAACVAMLAGLLWVERPHLLQDLTTDVATARGERREIGLPDGSTALLDADTALDLRFSADERRVHLLRGRAFFDVRKGEAPFVVQAAAGEARVLGTSFSVALNGPIGSVTVMSGVVQVTTPDGGRAVLNRGQQARYDHGGVTVASVDADEALAWRAGRLVFHQATLREVTAMLERHRPGRIVILDGALARRRVSGSFAAADTEAALTSLQSILGFTRQDITARVVTLR